MVTETFGTVNMQFYVYGDAGSGNGGLIATASSSFQVERGVPITLPDPTDDYETLLRQILSALSQIQGKLNFDDTPTIGSQNPVTSDGIAKALNTKASLQEDNTFEGYNTFQNEAYFDNAAYFDAGAFMYGMTYYLTDGPNRNDYYCYLTYNTAKILIRFFMSDDQFDIEIPQKGGTIALLSDLTPIEEEVSKKYDKTGGTIDGNVTVTGDLTVQGTTITENAETLDVKANVITTNSEGAPLINLSGLGIRTNATNVYGIMYDPQSDSVKLGLGSLDEDNNFTFNQGEGLPIAVRDDSTAFTDGHVIVWDAAGDKLVDGGKAVSDFITKSTKQSIVYGNMGMITEIPITQSAPAQNSIPVYDQKNNLHTSNPVDLYDATNKQYVDNQISEVENKIPTDYATQTALANTQRQVDGLYTLLEQKNEIYVQTATDTYTTRETAGGENIADGVQTPVKKITGKTVKTTNLIPYPYVDGTSKETNGVTFTVNSDRSITANGATTGSPATFYIRQSSYNPNFISGKKYYLSGTSNDLLVVLTYKDASGEVYVVANRSFVWQEGYTFQSLYFHVYANKTVDNVTVYPMLNEGSTAKPYMPYFPGLKNAFFKEIVSTGRNLIPYPYVDKTTTINGVTFTANSNGTVRANGTATDNTNFVLVSNINPLKLDKSKTYTLSGCPSGGSVNAYRLFIQNTTFEEAYSDAGNGTTFTANYTDYYIYIIIIKGTILNNLVFKPMINYGSSALPYEPYTKSVLSLPEAVELTEYDTAYPETGEIQRQSNTITFNGTEEFTSLTNGEGVTEIGIDIGGGFEDGNAINCASNYFESVSRNQLWNSSSGELIAENAGYIRFISSQFGGSIESFKSQLAAWNEAGNPLTVTYKTAEATTEQADFSADSYIAWKNGSETIEQGDTDNSEYGAENTVEQDYYLLTAPQEVTKE